MTGKYKMWLFGQFRLEDSSGQDITPRSAKMQAILAMLAVSPESERARIWFQNRLWSDRGSSQAAASLRQDISEFRKSIKQSPPPLEVTRRSLRLDRNLVEFNREPGEGEIFLEGIRVRDPAFRVWLMGERERFSVNLAPQAGRSQIVISPSVVVRTPIQSATKGFLASRVIETVVSNLSERASLEIIFDNSNNESGDYSLTAEEIAPGDKGGLRIRLDDIGNTRLIWSGTREFELLLASDANDRLPTDESLGQIVNEISEQLLHECVDRWRRGNFALDATVACMVGIKKLFTFDIAEQEEADRLFELAFNRDPRGLYLAWRVMLRVIRFIELPDEDITVTREEIVELSARARDLEPRNSMVLAAAANAALLVQDDMLAARELARRALSANPANPFAWDCNSIWHLMAGEFEKAHMMQLRALALSSDPHCKHWWDMGCSLTATVTGRLDEARYFAESAAALFPSFRPPLRYLTALYAHENRIEDAEAASKKLKLIEPDFTLDRMVSDPSYPSAALKRSELANRDLVRRLTWAR